MTAFDPLEFDPVVAKVCALQAKAAGLAEVGKPATALNIRLHADRILGQHIEGNTQWIEQGPTPRRAPAPEPDEVDDGMVTDDGAGFAWAVGLVILGGLLTVAIALLAVVVAARIVITHPQGALLVAGCVAAGVVGSQLKHLLAVKR